MTDNWDSADEIQDEGPLSVDLDDLADEGESETIPCPSCGIEIYEDSHKCSACGEYISPRWAKSSNQPLWWTAAIIVAIALILYITTC